MKPIFKTVVSHNNGFNTEAKGNWEMAYFAKHQPCLAVYWVMPREAEG